MQLERRSEEWYEHHYLLRSIEREEVQKDSSPGSAHRIPSPNTEELRCTESLADNV